MQNAKDLLKKPFDREELENFKRASTMTEAEFAQVSIPMDENADIDEVLKRLRWNGAFGPDGNIYERAAAVIERLRAQLTAP